MASVQTVKCPVCRRKVRQHQSGVVVFHNTPIKTACPMSGQIKSSD